MCRQRRSCKGHLVAHAVHSWYDSRREVLGMRRGHALDYKLMWSMSMTQVQLKLFQVSEKEHLQAPEPRLRKATHDPQSV